MLELSPGKRNVDCATWMRRALYYLFAILEKEEADKHQIPLKKAMCWYVSSKKTSHSRKDWSEEHRLYQFIICLCMDVGEPCFTCFGTNFTPHNIDEHKFECDSNKQLKLCPFCKEEDNKEAKEEAKDGKRKKVESRCKHGAKGGIFGQWFALQFSKFALTP